MQYRQLVNLGLLPDVRKDAMDPASQARHPRGLGRIQTAPDPDPATAEVKPEQVVRMKEKPLPPLPPELMIRTRRRNEE